MDLQRVLFMRSRFRIDDATYELLRRFLDYVRPELPLVVDQFASSYLQQSETECLSQVGQDSFRCLSQSLLAWLQSALSGTGNDVEFYESRQRIGKAHVRIELPQELMLVAMNMIRENLQRLARTWAADQQAQLELTNAVNRVLDFELMLVLDSYREHQLQQLKTAERLATIGQLAASVGHELRNPLGTIETGLYLIGQRLTRMNFTDEGTLRHVEKSRKQVQLCAKIIADLLELARSRVPTRQLVDVESVVDESFESLEWPGEVTRQKSVTPGLTAYADPAQLRSVIVNLMENARDAMAGRGEIAVQAFSSRDGVLLRISDTGPGIGPERQSRVFEPLYTTKANGNGLGLALCQRIVAAHGGTIGLESTDVGARFVIWLPGDPRISPTAAIG